MLSFDKFLDLYFQVFLEGVAILPPKLAYCVLPLTGNLFRDFSNYASSYEPGALRRGLENIERTNLPLKNGRRLLKEYLRFETRFTLENIWIRKDKKRYILSSFHKKDIELLSGMLNKPSVIVTAHNSGIYMLVKLIQILGAQAPFLCMNVLRRPKALTTPMQRAHQKMWVHWEAVQPMIYVEEGNAVMKSKRAISSGQSVILAIDVPGYANDRCAVISLFGMRLLVPKGAARIANECELPIVVAIPWASSCDSRYKILLRRIHPDGHLDVDTARIAAELESVLAYNPACWNGWLYLDRMLCGQ